MKRHAPLAQLVEQLTLNQRVPGSESLMAHQKMLCLGALAIEVPAGEVGKSGPEEGEPFEGTQGAPVGQAVKTPASHAGNAGSIPARVTRGRDRLWAEDDIQSLAAGDTGGNFRR